MAAHACASLRWWWKVVRALGRPVQTREKGTEGKGTEGGPKRRWRNKGEGLRRGEQRQQRKGQTAEGQTPNNEHVAQGRQVITEKREEHSGCTCRSVQFEHVDNFGLLIYLKRGPL